MKGLAFLFVLALMWAAGLYAFAQRVTESTPAPDPPHADGVVALTGGSSVRIEAAVQLLEDGKADRLLVSGVNPDVTRPELQAVAHDFGRAFNCCVDLGFQAANTQGNARETAGWAAYHHYRSLIVVTADFHIPRAMLELHAAMPGVTLYPYPVVTATLDVRHWLSTRASARRMVTEYCKYLVILAREAVRGLGHRHGGAPGSTAPAQNGSAQNALANTP